MRSDWLLLHDIHAAVKIVRRYTPSKRSDLDTDLPIQSVVLRFIQIIGEASWRLSDTFKTANASIPWQRIAAMRHVLVHDYFRVDLDQVWNVATIHIPALEVQIDAIVAALPASPTP